MLEAMLLSQHLVSHQGPAIQDIIWEHDLMGISKSHGL